MIEIKERRRRSSRRVDEGEEKQEKDWQEEDTGK